MRHSYGRRTARYSNDADVHGKLRAARFDLPPASPGDPRSPQEIAEDSFRALPQGHQDELTGWIVDSIRKVTPRAPYDGGPNTGLTGLLRSTDLARQASQDMNRPVTVAEVAGAALALDFNAVTTGWGPADLNFAAEWKDS